MKTTKDMWDSMSPEEREKCPLLEYVNKELLQKPWEELPRDAQEHFIILLLGYKGEQKGDKK